MRWRKTIGNPPRPLARAPCAQARQQSPQHGPPRATRACPPPRHDRARHLAASKRRLLLRGAEARSIGSHITLSACGRAACLRCITSTRRASQTHGRGEAQFADGARANPANATARIDPLGTDACGPKVLCLRRYAAATPAVPAVPRAPYRALWGKWASPPNTRPRRVITDRPPVLVSAVWGDRRRSRGRNRAASRPPYELAEIIWASGCPAACEHAGFAVQG